MNARSLVCLGACLTAISVTLAACASEAPKRSPDVVPRPKLSAPKPKVVPAKPKGSPVIRGPEGIELFQEKKRAFAALDVEGLPYVAAVAAIDRLRRRLERHGVKPLGPPRAIYSVDPTSVEPSKYRFRVAMPVPIKAGLPESITRIEVPGGFRVRVTHRGDFDEAYQIRCFERIPDVIRRFGYRIDGAVHEIYRSEPGAAPKRWITEVRYCVKRKAEKKSADQPAGKATGKATGNAAGKKGTKKRDKSDDTRR